MSGFCDSLDKEAVAFIKKQQMFFVATAPTKGRINLSPKGIDSIRILDENTLVWMNYTGSGNETAAHVFENERMTMMFCSFEADPLILRLYGNAKAIHERDEAWSKYASMFEDTYGVRQFFELKIDSLQRSCGWGVPLYEFKNTRTKLNEALHNWSEEEVLAYQKKKNAVSIDGQETNLFP